MLWLVPPVEQYVRFFAQNAGNGAADEAICAVFRTKSRSLRRRWANVCGFPYKKPQLAPPVEQYVRFSAQNAADGAGEETMCVLPLDLG